MVKPGSARKEKYEKKKTTSMPIAYETMIKDVEVDVYDEMAEIQSKVSEILTKNNINGGARVDYQRFAMKLYKFKREGTLTDDKLAGLVAYYVRAYGLRPDILREIAKVVVG